MDCVGHALAQAGTSPLFAVIAECALKSATVVRALVDHSKGQETTQYPQHCTIRLDKHEPTSCAQSAGRTRFKTPALAQCYRHRKGKPAEGSFVSRLEAGNFGLLQKKNMPQVDAPKVGVVVREPAQHQSVFRTSFHSLHQLRSFTSDAYRSVVRRQ